MVVKSPIMNQNTIIGRTTETGCRAAALAAFILFSASAIPVIDTLHCSLALYRCQNRWNRLIQRGLKGAEQGRNIISHRRSPS
jgi:hypothetical protein